MKPLNVLLYAVLLTVLLAACAPQAEPVVVRPVFPAYTGTPQNIYMLTDEESAGGVVETEALRNRAFVQRFNLIDQSSVDLALEQTANAQRGLIDAETAVTIGKTLGAKYALNVGTSLVSHEEEGINLGIGDFVIGGLGGGSLNDAQITLRLTDIETGQVVATGFGNSAEHRDVTTAYLDAAQQALDDLLWNYVQVTSVASK